jgi:hypothetical protein
MDALLTGLDHSPARMMYLPTPSAESGNQVPRHATPGEVAPQRERDRDRRVQMGARDRAHEQDDRDHRQTGSRDGGRAADHAVTERTE